MRLQYYIHSNVYKFHLNADSSTEKGFLCDAMS